VPVGYLVFVAVTAGCTVLALAPPRPRRSSPWNASFFFGWLLNELPFVEFYLLLHATLSAVDQGDIDSPAAWLAVGLAALTTVGLAVVARRGLRACAAVDRSLSDGLGAGWRTDIDAGMAARLRRRLPYARILFAPFLVRRRDVERVANVSYGDAGKRNLLDVYRHRAHPSGCPTLVYLHGGAFRIGSKNHGVRPLIYRLASQGWVCISANYRLAPAARFPDHLIDVKKVLAWVRETRARVRRRPRAGVRGGQLRRRSPGLAGCPHAQRARVPARIRTCGHIGHRRHIPVRLLRRSQHDRVVTTVVTDGAHRTRCAAVLRGARRSGHGGARGRRPTLRRAAAKHVV
jgi:hypothetical protein